MKIFISSVQKEFAAERKALAKYIREDAILGKFFEVFLFEEVPAQERSASEVYLSEVDACDLYLGLHGESYGNVDRKGVSATEREYDRAETKGKPRICFRRRRHKSMPVNPLLARAMYMRGYIEHVGSGTGDIIERCRAKGLRPPIWENEDDGCVVTIRRVLPRAAQEITQETTQESSPQSSPETSPQISPQNLSDGARSVLKMVSADDRVKTQAMADELGVSKRMVLNYIKELASVGLHFEGPTKKGRWVIEKQPVNKKRGGTK